ncbi:large-conductance mechanosensitive channel protein MscL [Massilibacteroides vaginae]|uniref:large-conductance mechanosensitive channel protein MscL n=1 Tax=Massilibacteroides vaginae TaxID=1673718 RepID=UPI000A1CC88F|nr:large-conductance mechanosensitive channel protein MscL [Massilibacteroides vaginae]
MLQEFKKFAMRGNVIDMAVGIIIGGAFGKIVSSVVGDLIMPVIGLFVGGVNFTDLKFVLKEAQTVGETTIPEVSLNYGAFIQTTFDFLIIAFAIFMLVKGINTLNKKKEEEPAAPAPPAEDIQLLSEIRDLLKEKK